MQREDEGSKLTPPSQLVKVRSPPLGQAQVQVPAQAPPEGPLRPCSPSPLVVVMVMVMVTAMATAVVVLAVFVVVAAASAAARFVGEVVVGLDEVSVGKKESGSGNDVAVMSPLCCQSSQETYCGCPSQPTHKSGWCLWHRNQTAAATAAAIAADAVAAAARRRRRRPPPSSTMRWMGRGQGEAALGEEDRDEHPARSPHMTLVAPS